MNNITYDKQEAPLVTEKLQDFSEYFNNQQLSDVTFIVDGERFFAHKSILCQNCKYFNTLLSDPSFISTYNHLELEIEIRDYAPIVFSHALHYIYTGKCGEFSNLDEPNCISLLDASVTYNLKGLQELIEVHIADKILSVYNVCGIWRFALQTGANLLASRCVEFFKQHSDQISQLPDFADQMCNPLNFDSFVMEEPELKLDDVNEYLNLISSDEQDLLLPHKNSFWERPSFHQLLNFPDDLGMNSMTSPSPSLTSSSGNVSGNSTGNQRPQVVSPQVVSPQMVNPSLVTMATPYVPIAASRDVKMPPLQQQPIQHSTTTTTHNRQPTHTQHHVKFETPTASPPLPNYNPTSPPVNQQYYQTPTPRTTSPPQPPPHHQQTAQPVAQPPNMPVNQAPPPPYYRSNQELGYRRSSRQQQQQQTVNTDPDRPIYGPIRNRTPRPLTMLQGPIWAKALQKMNLLIEMIRDLIGADIGTMFLHDPVTNELYSHITYPEAVDIALPSHMGIVGSCFTTKKTINSPAAYTDSRFYSGIDRQTGTPTLAILAVPIIGKDGNALGVIELLNKKRTTSFTAENEKELGLVCKMVARIVERATQEVKSDIEKKGLKRIYMYDMEESKTGRKTSTKKRRSSIPIFHFKQNMKPPEPKVEPHQQPNAAINISTQ